MKWRIYTLVVISQGILNSFNKATPNNNWNNGLSETPNKSQLDSLSASIRKLQRKLKAIGELDIKIAGELQDEELERDMFEAVEIQDGITERVDQIKRFISHHANPIESLPKPDF